ncbi:MAG: putative sugar nucleotidyl transferase [Lacibacter sp.]
MTTVLFDTSDRNTLYPFTAIRPVAEIRTGIFTVRERWEQIMHLSSFTLTEDYLQAKFPSGSKEDQLYIDAKLIPSKKLADSIISLAIGKGITSSGRILAVRTAHQLSFGFSKDDCSSVEFLEWPEKVQLLQYPFQINQWNEEAIRNDFAQVTSGRFSQPISTTNSVLSPEQIFIEEGAVVEHCILNASAGPIYIGKNSLLMEGSMIRGPFAALDDAVVKMGGKIYGATTVGRKCTVGGEIKNVMFFDYSNKAHDGYLGDAVIGEWCNVGAGASCSNIKNTAGEVKIWNQLLHQWISAGNKCGVMLGDYTKVAINSSLTTGLVSGICSNILTTGLSAKYIADFTWNIHTGEKYVIEKAIRDIDNWMQLKSKSFTDADRNILQHLYINKP